MTTTPEEAREAWRKKIHKEADLTVIAIDDIPKDRLMFVEKGMGLLLDDFKSSLRKCIEERIAELENDESEFSDEEVFFALRENRKFLELLDTVEPLKQ